MKVMLGILLYHTCWAVLETIVLQVTDFSQVFRMSFADPVSCAPSLVTHLFFVLLLNAMSIATFSVVIYVSPLQYVSIGTI